MLLAILATLARPAISLASQLPIEIGSGESSWRVERIVFSHAGVARLQPKGVRR